MTNEYDDNRPLSQRAKDGSLPSDALGTINKLADDMRLGDEQMRKIADGPPRLPLVATLSQEQIEAIAEAVANRVIAALKPGGK
jgi:hypothetical protein